MMAVFNETILVGKFKQGDAISFENRLPERLLDLDGVNGLIFHN
jgi:hypothetical protein